MLLGHIYHASSLSQQPPEHFWPQTLDGWATVVGVVAVVYGGYLAWRQLRYATSARHSALMADMSKRWEDPMLVESRRVGDRYGPDRLKLQIEQLDRTSDLLLDVLYRVPNFFEDLAVLEQEDAIPFEMIRKSLGSVVVDEWTHWKPAAEYLRGDQKYDLIYANFETLAEKVRKRLAQLGEALPPPASP